MNMEPNVAPEGALPKRSLLRRTFGALPTLVVLCALGALAVWGHRTGWKTPSFAALLGEAKAEKEDWCAEHNVPDSKCLACHPELAGENAADWCKEHGVPESRCTICHPEILTTGVAGDWCKEHGVPESGCTICHPEIARKGELPGADVTVTEGTHDGEGPEAHPQGITSQGGSPLRDPSTCQKHALKVQFASPAAVAKAGVALGQVVERPMSASVVVNSEIDYDRTRFAKLATRVGGTVWTVEKSLGEIVEAGSVLALIDSADVGRAKADFIQASAAFTVRKRTLDRLTLSAGAGFRTEAERLEAEALVREAEGQLFSAKQALVSLGLPAPPESATPESLALLGLPDSGRQLASGNRALSANLTPLIAPFRGVVVTRDVVAGEGVDASRVLFEIADTTRMWVTMDVPQAEAHLVALGQRVIFRPDDARDESVTGTVAWIATAVDEMTRTVKVRADVENPTGALRAHSFGRAQIVLRATPNAVAVPSEAVQWEGCCYVVFVRLTDTIFQTRKVRLGAKDAAYTEVLVGVLPGEVVATTASHVLKSEILKSNLGAGCTDD